MKNGIVFDLPPYLAIAEFNKRLASLHNICDHICELSDNELADMDMPQLHAYVERSKVTTVLH